MSDTSENNVILSLYPNTNGIGYSIFNENGLIEASMLKSRTRDVESYLIRIRKLIEKTTPIEVIIPLPFKKQGARVQELLKGIKKITKEFTPPCTEIDSQGMRRYFSQTTNGGNYSICELLIKHYPKLEQFKYPKRKVGQNEPYRSAIFKSAAQFLVIEKAFPFLKPESLIKFRKELQAIEPNRGIVLSWYK